VKGTKVNAYPDLYIDAADLVVEYSAFNAEMFSDPRGEIRKAA
jgi:hypothetical protein